MSKLIAYLMMGILLIFVACESTDDDVEGTTGTLVIQAFDAPFQGDVEHIYLNIIQVSVHKANADTADTTAGWIILSEVDTTIDFLELVNGQIATLIEENLETGQYSQLRLLLGDSSAIVVDGESHELKVPSGSQSGVKLNLGFSIEENEIAEIYLDFDASRSIKNHPKQDRYTLRPTFKVFKSVLSGTISGLVSDSDGAALEDIVIQAVSGGDTTSTLTSESGHYQFILVGGTYDLSAAGYELESDTSYAAVELVAESQLTRYDFTMN